MDEDLRARAGLLLPYKLFKEVAETAKIIQAIATVVGCHYN